MAQIIIIEKSTVNSVISTNNSKFYTYMITPHDAFTRPEF